MSIEQFIDNEVKSNDVVLFMKGTPQFPQCGFSGQVVQILDHIGVGYKGLNVLESAELRNGIKVYSNWPTIPQLYVKGEFVGGCETGGVKITWGYRLPAKRVIHAVGPVWNGGGKGEDELLASCYRSAIELCADNHLSSIAFPAISTGVYRFPADRAARIAVSATLDALPGVHLLKRVIFCCFSQDSARFHEEAIARL